MPAMASRLQNRMHRCASDQPAQMLEAHVRITQVDVTGDSRPMVCTVVSLITLTSTHSPVAYARRRTADSADLSPQRRSGTSPTIRCPAR